MESMSNWTTLVLRIHSDGGRRMAMFLPLPNRLEGVKLIKARHILGTLKHTTRDLGGICTSSYPATTCMSLSVNLKWINRKRWWGSVIQRLSQRHVFKTSIHVFARSESSGMRRAPVTSKQWNIDLLVVNVRYRWKRPIDKRVKFKSMYSTSPFCGSSVYLYIFVCKYRLFDCQMRGSWGRSSGGDCSIYVQSMFKGALSVT